jgi:hypothetical protein
MIRHQRSRVDRDYELPPILMAVYRHPTSRVLHFRNECRAMKFQRDRMTPLLLRADLMKAKGKLPGDPCRFCFGS